MRNYSGNTGTVLNSDSHLVRQYMKDIRHIPLLDERSEKYHAVRVQEYNDEASRNILATSNLRFVILIAKQYRNRGVSFADLIGEGNIGLFKAIERYSPKKNVRFITYAFWWIRQRIISALARQSKGVRIPENRFRDLYNAKKLMNELKNTTDWHTQLRIVGKALGSNEKYINALLVSNIETKSLDIPSANTFMPITDTAYHTYNPTSDIFKEDQNNAIAKLFTQLTPREANIMSHRFGLFGYKKLTLCELAKRFKLSKERIRQIEVLATFKLGRSGRKLELQEYIYN